MDFKALSEKLAAILKELQSGPVTVWSAIRVVDAVIHFILAIAGKDDEQPGGIRFGATADEHEEFVATCQGIVAAFRGNAFSAPSGPDISEGRLADFALQQLFAALQEWIAQQGFSNLLELVLSLLSKSMVPLSSPVALSAPPDSQDV